MDFSNAATDLVDALDCVFSGLALCERGRPGKWEGSAAGMDVEKLASYISALNFVSYGSQIK